MYPERSCSFLELITSLQAHVHIVQFGLSAKAGWSFLGDRDTWLNYVSFNKAFMIIALYTVG